MHCNGRVPVSRYNTQTLPTLRTTLVCQLRLRSVCVAIAAYDLHQDSPLSRDCPPRQPYRRSLSSMVGLSTTTCKPRRPRRRLRHPLLHNMEFSLRWLPSMAEHEILERILHLRERNTCGPSTDLTTAAQATITLSAPCQFVCFFSEAFPCPPRTNMRFSMHTHTSWQNFPTTNPTVCHAPACCSPPPPP